MINVLIAEDDYRVAAIHEQFLSKVDDIQLVGKALNGKETMDLLESYTVDLLLLDIYMPDELGTELLPKIKRTHPDTQIIMITAGTEKCLLEESARYGISNYLIKPVSIDRFTDAINRFKKKKQILDGQNELTQSVVDDFLGNEKQTADEIPILPKGIDPITLENVKQHLHGIERGMTAEVLGKSMGASRTTARRYLEYLISVNQVKAELDYGIVGRPERKYFIAD